MKLDPSRQPLSNSIQAFDWEMYAWALTSAEIAGLPETPHPLGLE